MSVKERQMSSMPGQFLTHLQRKQMQLFLLIYGKYDRSNCIIYAFSQTLCTPLIVSFPFYSLLFAQIFGNSYTFFRFFFLGCYY